MERWGVMAADHLVYICALELDDVIARIRDDRPNLFIGISTRSPETLAQGLNDGRFRPTWARGHVTGVRHDVQPELPLPREQAVETRDQLIRRLRSKGYTVNRNPTAYRTYVIDLHDPNKKDVGKGYIYVGQTSKTPEVRLREHLTGAVSEKGINLSSRVVRRFGVELNRTLMTQRIYLTKRQAEKAERRLAERLRNAGYVVEGGH